MSARKIGGNLKQRASVDEGISSDDDGPKSNCSNGYNSGSKGYNSRTSGGARPKTPSNGTTGVQERLSNELATLIVDQKESKMFVAIGALGQKRKVRAATIYQHDIKLPSQKKFEPVYDHKGVHTSTGRDFCDCLDDKCPGCHDDCVVCGGNKCGNECRCNRTWCHKEVIQFQADGDKFVQRTRPGKKDKPWLY